MQRQHIRAKQIHNLRRDHCELLLDVINMHVLLQSQVTQEIVVGDGTDASNAGRAEIHRHAIGFLMV